MSLFQATIRNTNTKGQVNSLRRNGEVPGIIYGGENANEKISLNKKDVKIFLFSENLDKRSLTRSHFEKGKSLAIVPCYQDNEKTLSVYLRNQLKDYQGLNQDLINMLIKNSGEDRKVLSQEVEKIKGLFLTKKIEEEKLTKLINNTYNIDFDHLRDSCLEADKKGLNKNLGSVSLQGEKAYFYIGNLSGRIQKLLDLMRDFFMRGSPI